MRAIEIGVPAVDSLKLGCACTRTVGAATANVVPSPHSRIARVSSGGARGERRHHHHLPANAQIDAGIDVGKHESARRPQLRGAGIVGNRHAVDRRRRRHVDRKIGRDDAHRQTIGRPVAVVAQANFVVEAFAGVDALRGNRQNLRALRELRLRERRDVERRKLHRADALCRAASLRASACDCRSTARSKPQRDARLVRRLGRNVREREPLAIAPRVDRAFDRKFRRKRKREARIAQHVGAGVDDAHDRVDGTSGRSGSCETNSHATLSTVGRERTTTVAVPRSIAPPSCSSTAPSVTYERSGTRDAIVRHER